MTVVWLKLQGGSRIWAKDKCIIILKDKADLVDSSDDVTVYAFDKSNAAVHGNAFVIAKDDSTIDVGYGKSTIIAYDNVNINADCEDACIVSMSDKVRVYCDYDAHFRIFGQGKVYSATDASITAHDDIEVEGVDFSESYLFDKAKLIYKGPDISYVTNRNITKQNIFDSVDDY